MIKSKKPLPKRSNLKASPKVTVTEQPSIESGQIKLFALSDIVRSDELDIRDHNAVANKKAFAELLDSIEINGLLKPVSVALVDGKLTLTDGHRRYRAVQELNQTNRMVGGKPATGQIPAYLDAFATNKAERFVGLINHNSGKQLEEFEQAKVFAALMQPPTSWSQAEIARRVGVTEPTVSYRLTLLKYPKAIEALANDLVSPSDVAKIVGAMNNENKDATDEEKRDAINDLFGSKVAANEPFNRTNWKPKPPADESGPKATSAKAAKEYLVVLCDLYLNAKGLRNEYRVDIENVLTDFGVNPQEFLQSIADEEAKNDATAANKAAKAEVARLKQEAEDAKRKLKAARGNVASRSANGEAPMAEVIG